MSAALVLALTLAAGPGDKRAPSLAACIEASQRGQEAKLAAKYQAAVEGFGLCSNAACPAEIRADCAQGLSEVMALTPTIVVAVRDDKGADLAGAEVLIEGVARPVDGKPVPLDPGPHEVTARSGTVSVTQSVLVSAGEKGRVITFALKPVVDGTSTPSPVPATGKKLAGPITMSAATLVGFGLFTGFGLAGKQQWEALSQQPCAVNKTCLDSQQSPIRTLFAVADVGLVLGVVAALAATVWWLLPE